MDKNYTLGVCEDYKVPKNEWFRIISVLENYSGKSSAKIWIDETTFSSVLRKCTSLYHMKMSVWMRMFFFSIFQPIFHIRKENHSYNNQVSCFFTKDLHDRLLCPVSEYSILIGWGKSGKTVTINSMTSTKNSNLIEQDKTARWNSGKSNQKLYS